MGSKRMLVVARRLGLVEADIRTDEGASLVGTHHNAIRRGLETGDYEPLRRFKGKALWQGDDYFELETDPEVIEDLANAGDLGYDDIYVIR